MALDFSSIENQGIDFSSLDSGTKPIDFSGIDTAKELSDPDVIKNLPDTLQFAIWDTGIKIPKELSAGLVGAGHMMTDIYRGVKQMLGIDEAQMKADQEAMDRLYADPKVGGYAIGGAVVGALAEPAGFLIPAGKAKSLVSAGKIGTKQAVKEIGKAAAKGAAVGATYLGQSVVLA